MSLTFKVEWGDPGGVRSPELRATWCRLEIWAGADCVTRVEEAETCASRRSIFVPLYPLAEWIAFNWWFLQGDHRPAALPSSAWTYRKLVRDPDITNNWLRRHNLRSAGEGFPWPDLTVVPEGGFTRIVWSADKVSPRGHLRYLSSGESYVPGDELQSSLANVVELTLTRLDENDVKETRLRDEWDALQRLDKDELAYCEAAARLGVDPFNTSADIAEALELVGDVLSGELLVDFLDAADPTSLRETLTWVTKASAEIEGLTTPQETDLAELRAAVRSVDMPTWERGPWELGLAQARAARSALGLADLQRFDVERFVSAAPRPTGRREIDGYGREQDGVRLVTARAVSHAGRRFASARALWHAVTDSRHAAFLLTRARTTRQKIERAFAAELLAPTAGIGAQLADVGSLWDAQDVDDIADHYGVRSILIEHQIQNNILQP